MASLEIWPCAPTNIKTSGGLSLQRAKLDVTKFTD